LDFDLQVDVLFECGINLIWCELRKPLFKKVNAKFDVKVFFLQIINVLWGYIIPQKKYVD
jgi:hypothetical protein